MIVMPLQITVKNAMLQCIFHQVVKQFILTKAFLQTVRTQSPALTATKKSKSSLIATAKTATSANKLLKNLSLGIKLLLFIILNKRSDFFAKFQN